MVSSLEYNTISLDQTQNILLGQHINELSQDDVLQIKNYALGLRFVLNKIKEDNFVCDIDTACKIHNVIAKNEALTWGKLRNSEVGISGTTHKPPSFQELQSLAETGFRYINNAASNIILQGILVFLFMSQSQFFHDVNKRTASLMVNGLFISNGIKPFIIMNNEKDFFHSALNSFYNTGDVSDILPFFKVLDV